MTHKKIQVVMLPTNEKAVQGDIILSLEGFTPSTKKGQLDICVFPDSNDLGVKWQTQHLYFLSDEEIKEGDWCLNTKTNKVFKTQYSDKDLKFPDRKKIIATTDSSLLTENNEFTKLSIYPKTILPQPSQDFINLFVDEYNEGKVIEWVDIEYDENYDLHYYTPSGGIECCEKIPLGYNLKINSNNEITIKPIKDNYSREEVIELIKSSYRYGFQGGEYEHIMSSNKRLHNCNSINEWISKNL